MKRAGWQHTDARTGDEDSTVDRSALREAALAGVRWTTIARLVAEAVGLTSAIVLAHLVPPAEFGRAAIALIVQAIAVAITAAGFGTPLVQRPQVQRAHLQAALLLALGSGVLMTAAVLLLAPWLVEPLFGARTVTLVQIASPLFLLGALGVVPHALLQRRLDFRVISSVDIVAVIVGAAVSIGAAALAGLEGEAVVLGVVAAGAVHSLGLLACVRIPLPAWRWHEMREIAAFGFPTMLSSLSRSGFRNVDYAIVAAMLGPAAAGLYWRAFQLGVEYQRKISGIVQRIALPLYARAATMEDKRALRARVVRTQAAIIFPLLTLFAATASSSVPWVFGPAWEGAVVPAQILAGAGMLAAVMTGMGPLVLAVGHPRALLAWDVGSLALYALAVVIAGRWGVNAVCAAVVVVYLMQLLAAHRFLLTPLVGIPFRSVWDDVAPAGAASALLLAVALPLTKLLEGAGIGPVLVLAAASAAAAPTYLLALRRLSPEGWSDLRLVVRRVLPGRKRGTTAPEPVATPV
jgi:PST family polysaccharide transporter